ncbi:hypothetical protein D3C76_925100 [compost metagenome]
MTVYQLDDASFWIGPYLDRRNGKIGCQRASDACYVLAQFVVTDADIEAVDDGDCCQGYTNRIAALGCCVGFIGCDVVECEGHR